MPSWGFTALGTSWQIDTPTPLSSNVAQDVQDELERIDSTWSRFRSDSLVARMAATAGMYELAAADSELLAWYKELYDVTGGKVTPLVGATLVDAGYDAQYSLQPKGVIAQTPAWEEVLQLVQGGVHIKRPWLLDVGAAGKGFAVDRIARILQRSAAEFTIDASGDCYVHGRGEMVGLEHPELPGRVIGTVNVRDQSICGSSTNRRAWGDWHHIIDPHTATPTRTVRAAWAVAPTAMHADGLVTALFFIQPEQLARLMPFLHVTVHTNGEINYAKTNIITLL